MQSRVAYAIFMHENDRAQELVDVDPEGAPALGWRIRVIETLLRATFVSEALWLLVVSVLMQSVLLRVVTAVVVSAFLLAIGIELWRPRLGERGRAWLLVSNFCVACLLAYLFVGFLSGAALAACVALLLSRALLGPRALVVVGCALLVGICLIAAVHVTERLPWPFPASDVSLQRIQAWLRTGMSAIVLVVVLSVLVSYLIGRIESTARENFRLLQEARRAVRQRDEFFSIASHELRTPVAALKLTADGILSYRIPSTPQNLQRSFGILQRNVNRLGGLVGQLLDVSNIERGRLILTLEDVDLSALVGEVAEVFAEQMGEATPISVTLEPSVRGRWDRHGLEMVATNLLSNAVKFGAGRPVEVAVRRDDSRALLTVRDHGVGILPELASHVFERFSHRMAPSGGGGLGLGLFIVKSVVERLGGTVHAETMVGDGAIFLVDLPVAGPPPEHHEQGKAR